MVSRLSISRLILGVNREGKYRADFEPGNRLLPVRKNRLPLNSWTMEILIFCLTGYRSVDH